MVDGASVFRHYWNVILPLLRPPLAALAVLMTTWIYNEFFWAVVLIKSDNKRPITSALGRLQGEFVTDFNLLAAGAIMAALPTLIIFFILKKQFVSGLTLGSTRANFRFFCFSRIAIIHKPTNLCRVLSCLTFRFRSLAKK